mmetsp:Transcript_71186/g.231263  ORF Transcript_71186/g.231263 Transcript_71186/m.231263 type:complete len:200 (-) Transcript_71186:181-780(-)
MDAGTARGPALGVGVVLRVAAEAGGLTALAVQAVMVIRCTIMALTVSWRWCSDRSRGRSRGRSGCRSPRCLAATTAARITKLPGNRCALIPLAGPHVPIFDDLALAVAGPEAEPQEALIRAHFPRNGDAAPKQRRTQLPGAVGGNDVHLQILGLRSVADVLSAAPSAARGFVVVVAEAPAALEVGRRWRSHAALLEHPL